MTIKTQDRPDGNDSPLVRVDAEVMDTNATTNGTPFRIRGDGVVHLLITHPDTTSAVGMWGFQVSEDGTNFSPVLSVPQVAKSSGTALTREPMTIVRPGGRWGRPVYTRTSGGAADEATVSGSAW